MSTGSLFDPPSSFDRAGLAARLRSLAAAGVWIGTSSWKYKGWLGQIYTRERYLTRGRFSQRYFESTCLGEYAETFPIVCGDFSFYQFPTPEYWQKLFGSAPRSLMYAFKAPEDVTVKVFPEHPRYGPRAGTENPAFLNPALFQDMLLALLEPYKAQVAALILEFGTFPRRAYAAPREFLADLERFLREIPRGWRYGVEIRNPELLKPEYFACLRAHGVAHVFNAWSRMPEIQHQMEHAGSFTAGFSVSRALLSRGRSYEEAVRAFSPYEHIQQPNPAGRDALRRMIARSLELKEPAFVFVNNRFEGNAPQTIQAIVEGE